MRKLCYELESGSHRAEVQKYRKLVEKIAKWHTDTVNQYSELLQYETSMTVLSTELAKAQDELDLSGDLSYNFGAKLAYFSIAEALIKLILSCYSYGPSREFFREHGFNDTLFDSIPDLKKDCTTPWLNVKYNAYHMTEIVAKVLRDDNICFDYDFVALLTERIIRNNLTHASEASKCLSAIRCYNCIRSMLVFLDQKYEDELRRFNFSVPFSFDDFLASPCDFNFENYTTILVVESVHDIRKDHRKVIANLPWDMVLDLDGYSDCGGLLSAVEHNRIMKSVLSTDSVKTVSFNRGETEWYRCGQYQQYNYIPRSDVVQIEIPAYNPFIVKPLVPNGGYQIREKYRETDLRSILRYIFKAAHKTDRPINIVAATDDFSIIKQIINTFHAEDIHEFFLTWVGITANSEAPNNILDSDEVGKNFAHFCCQSEQFFREFADRQAMFSVRTSIISSFSLMTKDGLVQIGENHRHNLSSCFEPLFDGCEMLEPELQDEARNSFYKGNSVASWYVIANQHAVQIRRPDEYKQLMDKIGSYLGVLQIKAQKRLFFIKHRPGIGGSTFVRQLAWDLHKSYTVLYVKHYESGQIVKLIEDLYDNVLNKSPIVLVADDTLTSVKSLCDDVMRIERRCMLIISCRNTNNLISLYQDSEQYALLSLPDTVIGQLRLKYQNVSNLPVSTLRERDAHFYENIQRDMNTPFIIGLYYLEKDYNVKSYVEKIFRECAERRYLDLLAYLAMFDRYNYKNVPASFVRSVLGLKPRDEILNIVPSISSLITKDASQTDSYRFKHNLLSSSYLSSYCQRFFENSIADMIYSLTKSIITIVAAMYSQNKLTDGHLNMLISVIIQNRNDYDTELEDLNLSTLLREVVRPEKQRSILEMLYNHFVSVADSYVEDDEISDNNLVMHLIRRLVSHACAHLGRMYSRGEQNYKLAREWIERGIQYVPDQDPDIFHMAGTITMDELRSCWKKDLDMLGMNSIERSKLISEQSQYENSLAQAESYFEKACDYGSPVYGYPSMLALYFHYLKYIFELKK